MSLAQARAVALALPPDDRFALALELLESAEPADEGAEQAWEAEIGRRVERLDRGEVQLIPSADVLRRIGRWSPVPDHRIKPMNDIICPIPAPSRRNEK
jgi:putative addiction module component (TIGR02574 family)